MTRTLSLAAVSLLAIGVTNTILVSTGAAKTPKLAAIEARQERQLELIRVGRETGSLTFLEGWKLKREQRRIAKFKRRFLSDGYLDRAERRQLRNAQNRAERNIWRERTDADVRGFLWRVFY